MLFQRDGLVPFATAEKDLVNKPLSARANTNGICQRTLATASIHETTILSMSFGNTLSDLFKQFLAYVQFLEILFRNNRPT